MFTLPKKKSQPFALIVADLHLHHLPAWRLDWCTQFVQQLLKLAKRLGYPDLILLGDALEIKDQLDARVMNLFIELILEWTAYGDGAQVYYIVGQHDSYIPYHATFESLRTVGPYVHVIDREPYTEDVGDGQYYAYIPYARELSKYREWLDAIKHPENTTVFTHLPVLEVLKGFGDHYTTENAISVEEFDRFEHTYSGDIHNYTVLDCEYFDYIGATSQRDFRDSGVDGCIGLLYPDGDFKRAWVQHPRHVVVKTKKQLQQLRNDKDSDYIIRLRGMEIEQAQLHDLDKVDNIYSVEIEPPPIEQSFEELSKIDQSSTRKQVIDQYLKSVTLPEGISKKDLRKRGLELVNEIN